MSFDFTINVGHLLTVVMVMAGGVGAWTKVQSKLAVFEVKLDHLETAVSELRTEIMKRYR